MTENKSITLLFNTIAFNVYSNYQYLKTVKMLVTKKKGGRDNRVPAVTFALMEHYCPVW